MYFLFWALNLLLGNEYVVRWVKVESKRKMTSLNCVEYVEYAIQKVVTAGNTYESDVAEW